MVTADSEVFVVGSEKITDGFGQTGDDLKVTCFGPTHLSSVSEQYFVPSPLTFEDK